MVISFGIRLVPHVEAKLGTNLDLLSVLRQHSSTCFRPLLHVTNETALSGLLVEGSSLMSTVRFTHQVLQLSTGRLGLAQPMCVPWASAGHTFLLWLGTTAYICVQVLMPATWPAADVHLLPMVLVSIILMHVLLLGSDSLHHTFTSLLLFGWRWGSMLCNKAAFSMAL